MPCIKTKSGWKIRRSKGGLYPKVYNSLNACKNRVRQMHKYRDVGKKVKKSIKKAQFKGRGKIKRKK